MSFYRDFAAKGASVSGVLCDFHLLDLLSQRGAISDPNLFSSLFSRGIVGISSSHEGEAGFGYLVPYLPVTPTSSRYSQLSIGRHVAFVVDCTYSWCALSC